MNAVEIEQAVSTLAEQPFNPAEFPFSFLEAFGNKATTIRRLRTGSTNKSDARGILQTNNIHLKVCPEGNVSNSLQELRSSPATAKGKVKFIVATDGTSLEAEDLNSGETVACYYKDFPDHFGFFLPLAGITTVKQIRENAFDIKATGRLNRLYLQLLKDNPDWGTDERRSEMNHFMARLIFCFFAEDTEIFSKDDLFTGTIEQMSESDASNMHEVISELFRAMATKFEDRKTQAIPRWADSLPYVNGGLFSGSIEVPRFTRIARPYLLHVGGLDWKKINPDIFGSMIQAVADDEERGELGMHYTSVPNILKVLNPLFLDDLRDKLEEAGTNPRKLLNLRNRLAKIRVFDPACGSGNFLVIAYKEMRAIEAEINRHRGETHLESVMPLTNFRGIEIRNFAAEIARLALIIAEYQCDVLYRGQIVAIRDFLPLSIENWITCGNALRLDWLSVCPPTGTEVKHLGDDLFFEAVRQHQIDFENQGGETYLCGNPPFKGARKQSTEQKSDLSSLFGGGNDYKDCDYVSGWYLKGAKFIEKVNGSLAFVSTSSICEGEQVQHIWSRVFHAGSHIFFAHRPFGWKNNASKNAGVTCVIVGLRHKSGNIIGIYDGKTLQSCNKISPYLVPGDALYITASDHPISLDLSRVVSGSMPRDGGHLILSAVEKDQLLRFSPEISRMVKRFSGTSELTNGYVRWCLWIEDSDLELAQTIPELKNRIQETQKFRQDSSAKTTNGYARIPHKFAQRSHHGGRSLIISGTSSQNREYLPADLCDDRTVISNAYVIYKPQKHELSIVLSKLFLVWVATVCGRMGTSFRFSKTLGWNTFPIPFLTEKNKLDLAHGAEEVLLAREAHFPKTIADLYGPDTMPTDLRAAHERNDETIERIYIGRRFKNDTERREKLFQLYTEMKGATA